jgi:glycosyltransferase involved in cell wall biosynthesis
MKLKKEKRIGIDLTCIWGGQSGIVNYTIEITNAILRNGSAYRFFLYCFGELPTEIDGNKSNVEVRKFRPLNRKLWQQTMFPLKALQNHLDLLFFPGNSASVFCPCTSVAMVHDLHPFVIQEAFNNVHSAEAHKGRVKSFINRIYWRQMMRWASQKEWVIVPSQATKDDLCSVLNTPSDKIKVIPEGVDIKKFCIEEKKNDLYAFRNRYSLPENYLLCVGTHGYKNLDGAIRAFSVVRRIKDTSLKLVIAGKTESVSNDIFKLIENLDLKEYIMFTGFFPDKDLKFLYQCAEVFLFPSYYEGFGLPILEAFACSVPVVTSNKGAMPEVAGDAALLADPDNPEEIAQKIISLLNNSSFRKQMCDRGIKRALKFDWESAGKDTVNLFSKALSS